jgi:hypothetical protein
MAIVRIDAYRTLGFASISAAFATVGTPLAHNWRIVCITNNTNGDMIFSVDGTTNNLFVPANSFKLFDISTNSPNVQVEDNLEFQIGTQFYVKQSTAATAGAVYIEGLYAQGE